jgi:hypothetical protein
MRPIHDELNSLVKKKNEADLFILQKSFQKEKEIKRKNEIKLVIIMSMKIM